LETLLKLYAEGHRNFSGSDLRGATVDIIDNEIKNLNLQDIILRGSNFTASDFTEADFRLTQLSGNFSYSNFCDTNFQKASFTNFVARGADFSNANLQDIEFPTNKAVDFSYSYYNPQTKFSSDFDPISRKMELIKDEILADD
jgi:uncharacterized protein YjbI with pentapeptide repeats